MGKGSQGSSAKSSSWSAQKTLSMYNLDASTNSKKTVRWMKQGDDTSY